MVSLEVWGKEPLAHNGCVQLRGGSWLEGYYCPYFAPCGLLLSFGVLSRRVKLLGGHVRQAFCFLPGNFTDISFASHTSLKFQWQYWYVCNLSTCLGKAFFWVPSLVSQHPTNFDPLILTIPHEIRKRNCPLRDLVTRPQARRELAQVCRGLGLHTKHIPVLLSDAHVNMLTVTPFSGLQPKRFQLP